MNEGNLNREDRIEFREHLVDAAQSVYRYNGTEETYRTMMDTLMKYEQWLTKNYDAKSSRISHEKEAALSLAAHYGRKNLTINDLLSHAQKKIGRTLRSNMQNIVVQINTEKVLLPPGDGQFTKGEGENELTEIRYEDRLSMLLSSLVKYGIHFDDVILIKGMVSESQMRNVSYVLVEIPRLGRDVLVCNQVGEATFVSEQQLGIDTYTRLTKERLQKMAGVNRIVYRNQKQWKEDVMTALFSDAVMAPKINVSDLTKVREEAKKVIPTAEEWVGMTQREKLQLKIVGKGLFALATIFGVQGNPVGHHSVHVALGAKIYGEENEVIKKEIDIITKKINTLSWGEEEWRMEVKKMIPTAEEWIEMNQRTRSKCNIQGKGLRALATIFGVQGDVKNYYPVYVALGAKIYGEESEVIKKEAETLSWGEEEWRMEVKKMIPTAREWIGMNQKTKQQCKIQGKGLKALATIFGVQGDPNVFHPVHVALGAKIYGEENEVIKKEAETLSWGEEEWRMEVKKMIPTAEEWLEMTRKEKLHLKIAGKGLRALTTIFGVPGRADCHAVHVALGAKIYGDENEVIKKEAGTLSWGEEEWRMEVKKVIPTAEEWLRMSREGRHQQKIMGKGLIALASIFDTQGNPLGNRTAHVELGGKIYGESEISQAMKSKD